jgi:hypothetical protein
MTASNDDCTSLGDGDIRFYDNYVPTLGVGDYLINVTQLLNPTTSPPINECHAASQFFSVQGPRYVLPTEDFFSVFPPDNAQGVFDQFLPHVVLTKRDLPWERDVFSDADPAQQTPWMALLLFVEDEQIGGTDALLDPLVDNWTPNPTKAAKIPAADFYPGTGEGILWPALEKEWYESTDFLQSTMCSIMDISPQAFSSLMPSKGDLKYLAHVRQVDPSAKDSDVLKVSGDGWYSILVGNRLSDAPPAGSAKPGKRNIAHLVSLEGWQAYLSGQQSIPTGTTRLRLISFKSWTFICLPELGESFAELMDGLAKDPQGKEKGTTFVVPVDAPGDEADAEQQYAYQALQNGYVPLSYQTRLGEQTFAWYRGPFAPVPVKNFISTAQQTAPDPSGWQPFERASSALVYDKKYGVFDVSYGVAWETGRLLALANPHFGQELLDFERKGHNLIDLILERKSQIAALQNFDPDSPDDPTEKSLLDQIEAYAVTGDFMSYFVTQFSAQIAPKLYAGTPDPPAAPFPPYPTVPSPVSNPQTIADLLTERDVQAVIRELGGQELDDIADWLAQLYLLIGVPFENLVPHSDMLPTESVRFFYLDSNWQDALVEGALSIGIESSRDRLYQDLMKDIIWNTTFEAVAQVRDNILGAAAQSVPTQGAAPLDQESLTGMLLRSAVVSGWPGLEVNAYAKTLPGTPAPDISTRIKLLRMERLSSDVMLCLWPAVPAVVTIDEPHEGIAFGFEDPPPDKGEGYYLYLRSLDQSNYGVQLCSADEIKQDTCQHMIDAVASKVIEPATSLIKLSASGGLLDILKNALPGSPAIYVRDFAVQMVKVPEQAIFAPNTSGD